MRHWNINKQVVSSSWIQALMWYRFVSRKIIKEKRLEISILGWEFFIWYSCVGFYQRKIVFSSLITQSFCLPSKQGTAYVMWPVQPQFPVRIKDEDSHFRATADVQFQLFFYGKWLRLYPEMLSNLYWFFFFFFNKWMPFTKVQGRRWVAKLSALESFT